MIGYICLWIIKRAIAHDRTAWEEIVAETMIDSSEYAYCSNIRAMQNRIAGHWGYVRMEEGLGRLK